MQKLIQYYLVIFVSCLPLYIIRFHFGWYPTTLVELLFFGFAILVGVSHFQNLKTVVPLLSKTPGRIMATQSIRYFVGQHKGLAVSVAVFMLSGVVSIVIAPDNRAALGVYKAYILEPITFFGLLLTIKNREVVRSGFVMGSSVLLSWLFILSASQILFHRFIFAPDELRLNRATGVFTTANALGLLLGPFGAFFSALALREQAAAKRLWNLILVVVDASILILSQSLTALFALISAQAVILGLYLFNRDKRFTGRLTKIAAAFLITIVVGSIAFFLIAIPKLAPTVYGPSLPSDSLTIRYYLWRGAIAMLLHHPLGAGFSGFPMHYAPYRVYQDDSLRRGFATLQLYPHQIVLNFWSEMGFFGMISFFGLCYYYFARLIVIRDNAWALGLIGAMVYILLHGIADVPYFKNDLAFTFWLFFGLAYVLKPKLGSSQ